MNKIKLNSKQKSVLIIWFLIIITVFSVWLSYGGEIFTKTKILVESYDEIFGTTKTWKNKFILGLDYTLGIFGSITLIAFLLIWKLRKVTHKKLFTNLLLKMVLKFQLLQLHK